MWSEKGMTNAMKTNVNGLDKMMRWIYLVYNLSVSGWRKRTISGGDHKEQKSLAHNDKYRIISWYISQRRISSCPVYCILRSQPHCAGYWPRHRGKSPRTVYFPLDTCLFLCNGMIQEWTAWTSKHKQILFTMDWHRPSELGIFEVLKTFDRTELIK